MTASQGQALENAILANPDDLGAHAAYADWLIEQGNPRGEFIQVQLALEDEKKPAKERKELQKREKGLLEKHQREWLGELADHLMNKNSEEAQHSFARGWLDHLGIGLLTGPLARALAAAPQARLLSSLIIANVDHLFHHLAEESPEVAGKRDYPGLEPLAKSTNLANVRQLVVGNYYDLRASYFHYTTLSRIGLSEVLPLVQTMPRLEKLYLEGTLNHVNRLFGLKTLNHLRSLQLCFAEEYPLEVLANNRSLGNLAYLMLHPQDGDEPAITLQGVRALVDSPFLKNLARLRLHMTTMGDDGCAAIVQSGILKRLKVLDLGFGNITDKGAAILAGCKELGNLELLDVQCNGLTKKGIGTLRKVGIDVYADHQHEPDDTNYLFEGEME